MEQMVENMFCCRLGIAPKASPARAVHFVHVGLQCREARPWVIRALFFVCLLFRNCFFSD